MGEVVEVYHHEPRNVIEVEIGGEVIRVTPKHPFYVRGRGFTAAEDLRPGDSLRNASGGWIAVGNVVDKGRVEPVFNIQVAGLHTYFVRNGDGNADVLVHNKSGGDTVDLKGVNFNHFPSGRMSELMSRGLATVSADGTYSLRGVVNGQVKLLRFARVWRTENLGTKHPDSLRGGASLRRVPAHRCRRVMPKVNGYWDNVFDTWIGYFWDGPAGIVSGLWGTVFHFRDTMSGLRTAFRHPLDTGRAILDDIVRSRRRCGGRGSLLST